MKRRSIRVALLCAVIVVLLLGWALVSKPSQAAWKLPTGTGKPALAIGANHAVVLASDGSLWTWGETAFGWHALGLGMNVTTQATLCRIGSDTNWVDIAVGGSTTLALKSDGTIWGWGENLYGGVGDGSKVPDQPLPVRSVPGNDWKQVATAGPHSLALKRDGTLWSWGNNWAGQLGDGTTNRSRVPVRVGSSTNWVRVWANLIENVGQQTDGSLWFWGWDYTRSAKGSSIAVPTRVSADTNWVDVGMGDWMVFAIKSDGTLWAWGRLARLFTGATGVEADSFPARVGKETNWLACASFSQSRPLFMKRDGSIWVLDASANRGMAVVTPFVTRFVTNNQLNCVANSDTLGGDPAFPIFKALQISYQLDGTNHVGTFPEYSNVSLGRPGATLTISRALYGDPSLFAQADQPSFQASRCGSARWQRIQLPAEAKDVVAFGGGHHGFGAALTRQGEVWTWGEALGRHTGGIAVLQFVSGLLKRVGVQTHWGEPRPVTFKEPERLGVSPANK